MPSTPSTPSPPAPSPSVSPVLAGVLDVVVVLLFAAIGRQNHGEQGTVVGVLVVAWPFLVGLAASWALVRWRSRVWPVRVGPAIVLWLGTVLVGMLLRAATGRGVAVSFVVVATLFLGLVLLGWRALLPLVRRWRA